MYDTLHSDFLALDTPVAPADNADNAGDNNNVDDDESLRARRNIERYCRRTNVANSIGELRELNCIGQLLTMPSVLLECRSLVHLSLVRTHVARVEHLSTLRNLRYLDLSLNVIDDISELSANENLETLILDFNLIEFLPPCVFRRLTKLNWLSLRKTFVSDLNFAIDSLQMLPALTVS